MNARRENSWKLKGLADVGLCIFHSTWRYSVTRIVSLESTWRITISQMVQRKIKEKVGIKASATLTEKFHSTGHAIVRMRLFD